ncbi:hypothetical protein ABT369_56355 [Dactylosporangium sp. NPDC000244]|uniref:hypothetical protein n=1 Tax=Dactylosporangium sp. NPDC000244 TaxID=3154365 RepID=UPI0033325214
MAAAFTRHADVSEFTFRSLSGQIHAWKARCVERCIIEGQPRRPRCQWRDDGVGLHRISMPDSADLTKSRTHLPLIERAGGRAAVTIDAAWRDRAAGLTRAAVRAQPTAACYSW